MGIFRLRPKEDRAAQEPSQNLLRDFGEVGVFFLPGTGPKIPYFPRFPLSHLGLQTGF